MTDEIKNPSHEGRWHEGLGRKLTEHELDGEDLTDWQESQTTQKWIVWKCGNKFWSRPKKMDRIKYKTNQ